MGGGRWAALLLSLILEALGILTLLQSDPASGSLYGFLAWGPKEALAWIAKNFLSCSSCLFSVALHPSPMTD